MATSQVPKVSIHWLLVFWSGNHRSGGYVVLRRPCDDSFSTSRPSIYILDPADRYGNSGPVHHVIPPLLAVLLATAVSSLKQRTADKFICLNSFRCHMSLGAFFFLKKKKFKSTKPERPCIDRQSVQGRGHLTRRPSLNRIAC